jgi:hypothetical protein
MAFRKSKSDRHRHDQKWQAWIGSHREELTAMGLPSEVYLDEARWKDFLATLFERTYDHGMPDGRMRF